MTKNHLYFSLPQLTGIVQEMVDNQKCFPEVIRVCMFEFHLFSLEDQTFEILSY